MCDMHVFKDTGSYPLKLKGNYLVQVEITSVINSNCNHKNIQVNELSHTCLAYCGTTCIS
jgi:hypothetical protein